MSIDYHKNFLNYEEQVELLISRGFSIRNNKQNMIDILKTYGLTRISDYATIYENEFKQYHKDSLLSSVEDLIQLDNALKNLLFLALEKIEIKFREAWAYHLSNENGMWAYKDERFYKNKINFYQSIALVFREIENSKDKSIISKLNKYLPHTLPNHVVKDIFTFGQLSRHFGNFIPNQTANLIAREFYLEDGDMLKSWLSHFVEIRNCIAHHEIIWNKNFISRPKIPNNKPEYLINQFNKHSNKLYNALTMLNYMGFFRNDNIINMFEFHSPHFLSRMGFPPDWQDKPIWNSQKEKP